MHSVKQIEIQSSGTISLGSGERRVAIITGSGQGIGKSLAEDFAAAGYTVVIADRDATTAQATATALTTAGHQSLAITVDVSDAASVENMVNATVEAYGRIDVLINNAAVFSTITMRPFDEIPLDEWEQVLDVNLTGVFLCCRGVAATMRAQGFGRIINMSSSTVLFGRPHYLHYVASKAGVVGITRGLARELGSAGITVNSVMPGSVDTGIERDSASSTKASVIVASQSVPRRLVPSDIVGATLFLASDAAGAITGQTIVADGGANFL